MADDKGFKKSFGDGTDNQGTERSGMVGPDQHGTGPDVGPTSAEMKQAGDRAFEGRTTQPAARSQGAIVKPDSATKHVGESINKQGNELAFHKKEPGRVLRKIKGAGRPAGMSSARYATGVNPQESITDGPYWPRA